MATEGGTDYACQPNTRQCVGHACTCLADVLVNATVLDAATLDIASPKITIKTSPAKTVDWQFVSTSSLPSVHWDAGVELAN